MHYTRKITVEVRRDMSLFIYKKDNCGISSLDLKFLRIMFVIVYCNNILQCKEILNCVDSNIILTVNFHEIITGLTLSLESLWSELQCNKADTYSWRKKNKRFCVFISILSQIDTNINNYKQMPILHH